MDLHYNNHEASASEREAVDAFLKGEGVRPEPPENARSARMGLTIGTANRRLLLPALHVLQRAIGRLTPGAINYVSQRLSIPPAEAYGTASFYALFSFDHAFDRVLHVCDDIACRANGAEEICQALETVVGAEGTPVVGAAAAWKRSPCLGLCERGTAALCQNRQAQDFSVEHLTVDLAVKLLRADPTVSPRIPGGSDPQPAEARTILKRVGKGADVKISAYLESGGYQALKRAFQLGRSGVIQEVADAGLTGRGGAAFPTGVKWKAVFEAQEQPHYIVCNADESEPGTFKDRILMEQDPFALIEAITVAGYACHASKGYIYIRGEYPEAAAILTSAIEAAANSNHLGKSILHQDFDFDIEIRIGAGAYICGEETALLNSIEGRRGEPRTKPPFPVTVGLFKKPTAINNVETLVNVIPILVEGAARYREKGTPKSPGTRLFCLSGCVQQPGLYEAPYGVALRDLLEMAGGVRSGRSLRCVLLGGAAGVFVRADELDIELSLEGVRGAQATLGSGVVMVFDDTVDMAAILLRIAAFFRDESCGQCVPCRVGAVRQEESLHRLVSGGFAVENELTLLRDLDAVMREASICGLGQTASSAIQSGIYRAGVLQLEGIKP